MASTTPKAPAFGYLRVSGKGQLQGDGFPRQRKAINNYADNNRFCIVESFEEKAVPGKTEWEDRPAWNEMLQKITANGVRTIVIEKLDRLARDLMVQEHIVVDLQKRGITLISTMEPDLCASDPTRIVIRQIMGAIAQYDKSMLVHRLRGARDRKRIAGKHAEGPHRYGHDPKRHPDEAAIRDRIRQMRKATPKPTFQAICDTLNAEGVKTRKGRPWLPAMIWRIARRAA